MNRQRMVIITASFTSLFIILACNIITGGGEDYSKAIAACQGNAYIKVAEELLGGVPGPDYDVCGYRYTFTNNHPTDTIELYLLVYKDDTLGGAPTTEWVKIDTLAPGASTIYTCNIYHFGEQIGDDADDYVPPHTSREILHAFTGIMATTKCYSNAEINDDFLTNASTFLEQKYCK